MLKSMVFFLAGLIVSGASAQPGLTGLETRWLRAAAPVLDYARQIKLPVDIIVQPVAKPGDVPFAMGFVGGRCKLVLSMRGNPQAEDVLAREPEAGRAVLIEAMTAHEIGHCWRYAQGHWHVLPAGFVELGAPDVLAMEMRDTRREEGFSDLAALAWTHWRHPADYARVHAWLGQVRATPQAGGSHDTGTWIALAGDAAVFAGAGRGAPFEQAEPVWKRGLSGDK